MLDKTLNNLLETIERNGEFEKYVEMLADRVEKESRMIRRNAREMKRLELGDDYVSSDTEDSKDKDDSEVSDSYGEESEAKDKEQSQIADQSPLLASGSQFNEDGTAGLKGSKAGLSESHTIAVE